MGATKTDGTMWVWGRNDDDMRLGLGDRTSRSSPTQIPGTTWDKIEGGVNIFMATKTDGTLWGWGLSSNGNLGLNSNTTYNSPVQIGTLTTWGRLVMNNRNSRMSGAFVKSF